jgi:hypothetical protein
VQEAGLAHAADALNPSRHSNLNAIGKLFARFLAVLIDNLRNGKRVLEPVAIRLKPEPLNLLDSLVPLAQQFIF